MKIIFFIAVLATTAISCVQRPILECSELNSEFNKRAIIKENGVYYWNGKYETVTYFLDKHENCIKSLSLRQLKKQFGLLKHDKANIEFPYSIRIHNIGAYNKVDPRFGVSIFFKINPETNLVDDYETKGITRTSKPMKPVN